MDTTIEFQGKLFQVDATIARLVEAGDANLLNASHMIYPTVYLRRGVPGTAALRQQVYGLKRLALLLVGQTPGAKMRYAHRNGDPLDCRAENLMTQPRLMIQEMAQRRVIDPATRNIQSLPSGRFRVRAYDPVQKRAVNAGTFDTLEEAQAFRDGVSDLATSSHSK
jgi:hypothetical protein